MPKAPSSDLTYTWPSVRVSPENKARAQAILDRARSHMSFMKFINAALSEFLDQVEKEEPPSVPPIIETLRKQLDLAPLDVPAPAEVMAAISEMQENMEMMRQQIAELQKKRR
jgi:hypothetical protein